MKKVYLLILILAFVQLSASCETLNYKIKQSGSSMVIVPYYSSPVIEPEASQNIEQTPAKIPFMSQKITKRQK